MFSARHHRQLTLVIAHRGASAYEPENTIAAFARAVELGANGIELDVRVTGDGAIVVYHDPAVNGRPLTRLSLEQLRQTRPTAPTLTEALRAIGTNTTVYIELKALPESADGTLLHAIDVAPNPDQCQIHSFDHRIVRRLVDAQPSITGSVLSSSYLVDPLAQIRNAHARGLWQEASHIDKALVDQVHSASFCLYAWTVDDPVEARALRDMGVDGICSNEPDVIKSAIT